MRNNDIFLFSTQVPNLTALKMISNICCKLQIYKFNYDEHFSYKFCKELLKYNIILQIHSILLFLTAHVNVIKKNLKMNKEIFRKQSELFLF